MNTTNLQRFPKITATLLIVAGMVTAASYCLTPAVVSILPRATNNIVDPGIPALVIVGKRMRAIAPPLTVNGQATQMASGAVPTGSTGSSKPVLTAQIDKF